MTEKLLPCPFCGGEARISRHMSQSLWSPNIVQWTSVECDECDECEAAVGQTCEGYEVEAIDAWNRRASPPAEPEINQGRQPKKNGKGSHFAGLSSSLIAAYGAALPGAGTTTWKSADWAESDVVSSAAINNIDSSDFLSMSHTKGQDI